jgi:AcrR family transcriptional regulator
MVGVVPNAAYRHFADRDELLASVCTAAMRELAARMAAGVGGVPGKYGDPAAARGRLRAIGRSYLEFAREEPGLFATAFALPHQHAYDVPDGGSGQDPLPLDQLRAVLDELADAGVLDRRRRVGIEYPIWSTVHGLAVLTGQGPLRDAPAAARHHLEEATRAFIEAGLALARFSLELGDPALDRIDEIVPPGTDLVDLTWKPPALTDPALRRRLTGQRAAGE